MKRVRKGKREKQKKDRVEGEKVEKWRDKGRGIAPGPCAHRAMKPQTEHGSGFMPVPQYKVSTVRMSYDFGMTCVSVRTTIYFLSVGWVSGVWRSEGMGWNSRVPGVARVVENWHTPLHSVRWHSASNENIAMTIVALTSTMISPRLTKLRKLWFSNLTDVLVTLHRVYRST